MRKQLRLLLIHEGIRRKRKDWLPHVDGMKGEVPKPVVWPRSKGRRHPDRSHRSLEFMEARAGHRPNR